MATTQVARRVFVGLILLSIVLVLLVISPFFEAFFLAAVLAGAFHGLQKWLTRHLRGKSGLAAGLICVGIVLALLVPLAALTTFIVSQTVQGVNFISNLVQQRGLEGLLAYVPGPFKDSAARALESFQSGSAGMWQRVQGYLASSGAGAAHSVGGFLAATGTLLFQTVMMLIALYFLLVDGERLVAWLESVSP